MEHLQQKQEDKLKQVLVASCPDCGMDFSKARTAEHHILCNDKEKYTCKQLTHKTNET